jgi:hypothetical protein
MIQDVPWLISCWLLPLRYVSWRADELCQSGVQGQLSQALAGRRLRDAKVDYFGHWHSILQRDQDVGRFYVAVNNAFLMSVLDGSANLEKEVTLLAGGEIVLVAIIGDGDALDSSHHPA